MIPHHRVQVERSTAGGERRQTQKREREQDESWKTGVPDLQQAESSTVSLPIKESPAKQLTAEYTFSQTLG
eukprot:1159322-Pelagomonas_calceolata.AAC.1